MILAKTTRKDHIFLLCETCLFVARKIVYREKFNLVSLIIKLQNLPGIRFITDKSLRSLQKVATFLGAQASSIMTDISP